MRKIITLVMVLILGVTALPLAAQTDPRCSALTEEDCTILVTALETFNTLGSINNADFSVELGGGGGTSTGNQLSFTGSGPMLIDEAGAVTGFDFAVTDSNGENGEVIWLDDTFFLGRGEGDDVTWQGTELENDTTQVLLDLLSGNIFTQALDQPNVSVTQRLDDTEQNGQTMQVFQTNIDLITLLLTPDILQLLEGLMAAIPQENSGGFQGSDLAGAIPLLGLLLEKDVIQIVIWVGEDDGMIYHAEFLIDVVLDPTAIDPNQQPLSFLLKVISDLDQHGESVSIEVPSEYEPLDLGQFDIESMVDNVLNSGGAPEETIDDNERYAVEFPLAYGESVTGTLTSLNPQDVWGLDAQAGDVITIVLKASDPESILDTRVYLRGLNGEEILLNDDHSTDREDLGLFDSVIENYTVPEDGEYRIVATWLAEVTNGGYELIVEVAE